MLIHVRSHSTSRTFALHTNCITQTDGIVSADQQATESRSQGNQDIIVIGGGPAGLMAADVLSSKGFSVTLYDRMPSPGRKFLLAGRGGLNITHSEPLDAFLTRYKAAAPWLTPLIEAFSPEDMRQFCHDLGQETFTGSSGRVFPKCFKTSPLLRAWLRKLASAGVRIRLRHEFLGWNDEGAALFRDAGGQEIAVAATATILAMGGGSWPRLGSTGLWVATLAARGVSITPLRPANCGFLTGWDNDIGARYAGEPLKSIALEFAGQHYPGECVITETGLEGGVIYAASADIRDAIEASGEALVCIDLKPGVSVEKLAERLAAAPRKQSLSNRLRKGPRLRAPAIALLRQHELPTDPMELARLIKRCPVRFTATRPLERAISTAGGIMRESLDANLMVKKLPGVFAAGEMLDWEAPTGGYLLQACFATGAGAAEGVIRWLNASAGLHRGRIAGTIAQGQ
ncbi:MAG: TIGR03862 family flavoprotein [Hyphomicrobiales bacterium]|nr:TIGR03862 family flavoprotein [Hyphomicrobiales bacterium]